MLLPELYEIITEFVEGTNQFQRCLDELNCLVRCTNEYCYYNPPYLYYEETAYFHWFWQKKYLCVWEFDFF